jgi:hypothetical protein
MGRRSDDNTDGNMQSRDGACAIRTKTRIGEGEVRLMTLRFGRYERRQARLEWRGHIRDDDETGELRGWQCDYVFKMDDGATSINFLPLQRTDIVDSSVLG